ncbi:MAG: isoprenylcysteine carboxylmethyltransferase family protein [Thermoanaerobaculia bacterium]
MTPASDPAPASPSSPSLGARIFTVARGLVWSAAFVALWTWLAAGARGYDRRIPFALPAALRPVGYAVALAGALLTAACVATFVTVGRGTPALFDPPREFVASGPYRFVRNPMYVGGAAVLLGAGLALSSPGIVALAFVFLAVMHLLVILHEEPSLTEKFGESYRRYRSSVSRWRIRRPRPAPPRSTAG